MSLQASQIRDHIPWTSYEHSRSIACIISRAAGWWSLLSPPEHYVHEASEYQQILDLASTSSLHTLLELGSGGGSNAFHLKKRYQMTLVDLSAEMLAVSQKLNPECEHVQGDMRTVRLGRQFDAVFIHDAICYMTSEEDLLKALVTACVHCQPGGVALFVPDDTRETFRSMTSHGGEDEETRGLRYLEWSWDPDTSDSTYVYYLAYVLREGKLDEFHKINHKLEKKYN
jgi:trans-aconitate methyltransferase